MAEYINRYTVSFVGVMAFDFMIPHVKRFFINRKKDNSTEIQRTEMPPLQGLQKIFEDIKFNFYNINGVKWSGMLFGYSYDDYWIDGIGYKISERKFNQIIKTTHELHNMCLEATDLAIGDDEILQNVFDIPEDMIPLIRESWKHRQPDLLSRYDFLMSGQGELYFLEVNGDTPSGIIEAGPAQRKWAQQQNLLQFNTLENNIAEGFKRIVERNHKTNLMMFKNDNLEDACTFDYIKSLVEPVLSVPLDVQNIQDIDSKLGEQLDKDNFQSSIFWRQYPLEWLANETPRNFFINPKFYKNESQTMIEPPWKIVMSNKAMSVLLKAMYPENAHLINSSLAPLDQYTLQLSKQKYAREGEDILFSNDYQGYYNNFLYDSYLKYVHAPIFQAFTYSDLHQDRYLTISSWVVSGQPSGILLREDLSHIIGTGSSVVPYYIKKEKDDDQPISVELENSSNQFQLRKSLYDTSSINSNDMMVSIKERTAFIKDSKFDIKEIKRVLKSQYESTVFQRDTARKLSIDYLSEEQIAAAQNPALIGFSPFFAAGLAQNNANQNQANNPQSTSTGGGGSHWYGGSGGGGSYYNTGSNATHSNVTPPKSGNTGRTFSSHS